MPELPEVETTRRGLAPHVTGRHVHGVIARRATLRWPIPADLHEVLVGQPVLAVRRRAKYLLIDVPSGSVIIHLGMSGSLRVLPGDTPLRTHDHVDICLDNGHVLRLNDPRRFGAVLWQPAGTTHELLAGLGPEPLTDAFDGDYLFERSRGRKTAVKAFVMDQAVVVGVGNIYAAESLYLAGISPLRPAGGISRQRYRQLGERIKQVLGYSIERGGTTLRDFISPDGLPGYFEQELLVYGREGQPCKGCGRALKHATIGQRATVWCGYCQR